MSDCITLIPRPSQEVADLFYLAYRKLKLPDHREWQERILRAALKLNQLENDMGKEANIITHLTAQVADLTAKLAAVPPQPDPATVKDAADVAAEAGFNADGTPVTPPVPPA